jgi:diguanylate cyclase (GGDEF)-like protein
MPLGAPHDSSAVKAGEVVKLPRYSIRITLRFALVLAVLLPALCAVTAAGIYGLQTGRKGTHSLYEVHLRGNLKVAALQSALQDVQRASLELLLEDDPAERQRLNTELRTQLIPAVQAALGPVAVLSAQDPTELAAVQSINMNWAKFESVLADQLPTANTPAGDVHVGNEINAEFSAAVAAAKSITRQEVSDADAGYRGVVRDFDVSIEMMLIAGIVGLLCSIATVLWLIRSVLPRTLSYSAFATKVGEGDYTSRLHAEGADELAQLGQVLDDLAETRQAEDAYDRNKLELIGALQLTENEHDAHELLQRHLERSIANSTVTVLHRNNSADRLQAMTPLDPSSPLAAGLKSAKPRSCLAIRMARSHSTSDQAELLPCPVCSDCPALTSCVPLIVSGEVIGSVLSNHQQPLTDTDHRAMRDAVTQAAPVIGNLRNLAVAELRAATDGLTGLPNRRAIEDTIRRMVAQTTRTMSPMAALMCDLDHFKNINDQYGHGRGDDVLAAAAAAISGSIRTSDFAGRYGGEEFIVLLPDTDEPGAVNIAEKIRSAVGAIRVPTVDRPITVSIGLALLPEQALDAESLQRAADRALYAAKNGGRNRVETFRDEQADRLTPLSEPTMAECAQDPSDLGSTPIQESRQVSPTWRS